MGDANHLSPMRAPTPLFVLEPPCLCLAFYITAPTSVRLDQKEPASLATTPQPSGVEPAECMGLTDHGLQLLALSIGTIVTDEKR